MTALIITLLIAWIASAAVRTARDRHTRKQFRENNIRWEQQYAWNAKQEAVNRKQAEINRKTEERLRKAEFTLSQAIGDIEFQKDRLAQLDAQRDYLMLLQSGTVPGGKEHTKYQTKIMTIDNQIHATENKLGKAEFNKAEAERKLREVA